MKRPDKKFFVERLPMGDAYAFSFNGRVLYAIANENEYWPGAGNSPWEHVSVSVKGSQFKAPSESQMRFVRSQFWDSDVVVIEKPSAVDPKNIGGTAVLHMFHQKSEEDHENECA